MTALLAAGCDDERIASEDPGKPTKDTSTYGHKLEHIDFASADNRDDYEELLVLDDGRKVAMHYRTETGLVEQHYSPEKKSWSKAQVIFETESDPCQGIYLEENDGRVGVIANWGGFCYDGEPPMQSLAATAAGSLQEWQTDVTDEIDGWEEMDVSADEVSWTSPSYPELSWSDGDFSGGP